MSHRLTLAPLTLLTLLLAACGGGGSSPTAPSSITTAPTTTSATTPTTTATAPTTPAAPTTPTPPANATLAGTWNEAGAPFMTLSTNGSSVTGTQTPYTADFGGIVGNFTGTITGTTSGTSVAITIQVTMVVRAFGDQLTCRGADSFSGQISGNTLTGSYTPFSTPYLCDGGIPLPLSNLPSGPRVFTKAQ